MVNRQGVSAFEVEARVHKWAEWKNRRGEYGRRTREWMPGRMAEEDKGADGQVIQVDTRDLHRCRSRVGGFESLQDMKLRTVWCVMESGQLASPKK